MVFFKIAIGSLLKRKRRVIGIGLLVMFGTILIVFGQEFALTAKKLSKQAIIDNLTGDFIVYSARTKEKPGPYTFSNPLTNIENTDEIKLLLSEYEEIEAYTAFAQAISIISVENGKRIELPLIYSAVEPETYLGFFKNLEMVEGSFFGKELGIVEEGIVISQAQNDRYEERYGVLFEIGDPITLYGIAGGGAVNAVKSQIVGIFEPLKYENSFNYINFMDIETYSDLYNFTGVREGSLPEELTETLLSEDEDEIFDLAFEEDFGQIDVETLVSTEISGFTMIAVHLNEGVDTTAFIEELKSDADRYGFKVAPWDEASGGLARISGALQGFIYAATALIFIIVALILMNTLIINIMERTSEIGTIRAIGARKGFVTLMFLSETLVLNIIAGLIGIVVSAVLLLVSGRIGIALPGPVSQFLIGGGRLYPSLSMTTVGQALLIIVLITILATLYPLRVANKVTPLKAMSEGQ
ncbi:MAG: FtsX-like permease family protein [Spirochaetota bacterium]|nr:MAG: FtsX-like permease family protein [Spirochaetota bacterium]